MSTSQIKIYEVGGSVRDYFLNKKSKDRDFCVIAPSFNDMRQLFIARGGKIYLETPQYFTIRGKIPGIGDADFTLARIDGNYSDGRHPDNVQLAETIEEELTRRDFSINAIAKSEDGVIIDPYDGQEHIKFRLITCVGKAEDRLSEDSLRMIRAIRFAITLNFVIAPDIEKCLVDPTFVKKLDNISIERIREELLKCFKHDSVKTMRMLMHTYPEIGEKIFQFENPRIWLNPTLEYGESSK